MTDTAEYWNDVKGGFSSKHIFTHAKGFDCGHFHVHESSMLNQIDCYACKEKMPEEMRSQFELYTENRAKQLVFNSQQKGIKKLPDNPVCTCGYVMIKRTNRQGADFFGCSHYPKCKCTKSI